MSDTVTACPECDSTNIHPRTERPALTSERTVSGSWYCNDCGTGFDTPVSRERHVESAGYRGDVRALIDADPDEHP